MAHEITIPRLGWSMEEGVLGEWLKVPGERVQAGDSLFTLEGEKAAQDIAALDTGILCLPADAPRTGDTVKVGQVIGFLLAKGESPPASVGKQAIATAVATPSPTRLSRPAGPAARRLARQLGIELNSVPTPDPTGRILCEDVQRAAALPRSTRAAATQPIASPRARRRAKELGIDWTSQTGTGRAGRIRERDVLGHRQFAKPDAPPAPAPVSPGKHVPASKRRSIIAQRMMAGVTQAAPVTLMTKVDAGPLVAYRNSLKQAAPDGLSPSYNDILLLLVARTLREQPHLNACWDRDGIHTYDDIHIAIAVDTDSGLLAPVIRHVDQLTLEQLTARSGHLIAEARSGRLSQDNMEGSTFTVTNLGMFGIDAFTPILNLPQAGILGIGRIAEEPIVCAGQLVAGTTLSLSLTFDHRVVDGAPAARWLQSLCQKCVELLNVGSAHRPMN
jgi:pyruvate dehydrogenase E2 component (dihydrolipoamide acetyltransferase)